MNIRQKHAAAGLFLLVLLAYLRAAQGGFVWDDDSHLTKNPCIVGSLGFAGIWGSSEAVYYPLVLTSFWVIHHWFGLQPLPYHLFTIVMHASAAVALWRVLLALRVRGAWLGAALWALHPVQVESVAWVTELKNTQSGLFYLLCILLFLRMKTREAAGSGGWRSYTLALLCFALAITSKSSTVMLPVVLMLCAWHQNGSWRWRDAARLAPFFLISALAGGWTIWEQKYHSGADGAEWALSPAQRLIVSGYDVWFYLGKLAWPHPLIFVYPRWQIDATHPAQWLPGVAVLACLLVFWRRRHSGGRALFFAFAYFVVSLFPAMAFFNVYFFRYSFVGDHFQYLASMGPLALAGAGLARLLDRVQAGRFAGWPVWSRMPSGWTMGGVVLAPLVFLSVRQQPIYHDQHSLWSDTLAKDPACWMGHDNLGTLLLDENRPQEALLEFRIAAGLKPELAQHHLVIGNALMKLNRTDEAITEFREAVRLDPAFVDALNNLGNALLANGRFDEAIEQYANAVRAGLGVVDSRNNLGVALTAAGRYAEAEAQYDIALQLEPNDARVHNNLGLLFSKQKHWPEAIAQCRLAVQLKPDYLNAWSNLASALESDGQTETAVGAFANASRLQPDSALAHYELGHALKVTGRAAAALQQYRQSLALMPGQPATLNDMAWLLATSPDAVVRDGAEALRLGQRCCEITANKVPAYLDTLAAAYAENGRFDEAVATARQAAELAAGAGNETLADAARQRGDLYRAGQTYRE